MGGTGQLELGGSERCDAAHVPDREVDLAEQQDEDDAERDHRHSRHLEHDVHEIRGSEEVRRRQAEEEDDRKLTDDDRQNTQVARLDVVPSLLPEAGALDLLFPGRKPAFGCDVDSAHCTTSAPVAAMPDTFVGIPAVIACTTSC